MVHIADILRFMNTPAKRLLLYAEKFNFDDVNKSDITLPPLQHSFGHIECPACEAVRGVIVGKSPAEFSSLRFSVASELWLNSRKAYLKPRTWYGYGQHIKMLGKFFGKLRLSDIHIGHVMEYQQARQTNRDGLWPKTAGASLINHELSAMQLILKRCGEWKKFEEIYEALPLPSWRPPKVMTDEEEMTLFKVAASIPKLQVPYFVASISNNTGAAGSELRLLQHQHLYLDMVDPSFIIPDETAKNHFRGRMIVLNSTALKQVQRVVARAKELGSFQPEHYLFPLRVNRGKWEPTKPASESWLRRGFADLRKITGLTWLTPHCLRHQFITLNYELGTDPQTLSHMVGHQSERMTRHYSHTRRAIVKAAVDKIDPANRLGVQNVRPGMTRKNISA